MSHTCQSEQGLQCAAHALVKPPVSDAKPCVVRDAHCTFVDHMITCVCCDYHTSMTCSTYFHAARMPAVHNAHQATDVLAFACIKGHSWTKLQMLHPILVANTHDQSDTYD